MQITTSEIYLILGAIDTHECELTAQVDAFDARHEEEMKALRKLSNKLSRELERLEKKAVERADQSRNKPQR